MTYDRQLDNAKGFLFQNPNAQSPFAPALEGYLDLKGDYDHAPCRVPCRAWVEEQGPFEKRYRLAFEGLTGTLERDLPNSKAYLPQLFGALSNERFGINGWIRYDQHGQWYIELEIGDRMPTAERDEDEDEDHGHEACKREYWRSKSRSIPEDNFV
jgi:hypothetical protein